MPTPNNPLHVVSQNESDIERTPRLGYQKDKTNRISKEQNKLDVKRQNALDIKTTKRIGHQKDKTTWISKTPKLWNSKKPKLETNIKRAKRMGYQKDKTIWISISKGQNESDIKRLQWISDPQQDSMIQVNKTAWHMSAQLLLAPPCQSELPHSESHSKS